jgi:hypothetical protein
LDLTFKEQFLTQWRKYFGGAELPITFYYTDEPNHAPLVAPTEAPHCLIDGLERVRAGESLAFNGPSIACRGGKRFTGFSQTLGKKFNYFLSCGIPGELEGERYKKAPELVDEWVKKQPLLVAPGKYLVFKRWDSLESDDEPSVIIFFARPDVLSGLFTLANFDQTNSQGVMSPMGSGCAAIIQYPLLELGSIQPHPIIGMFDVSARPHIQSDRLTFAIPWPKFWTMVENMDESFLITSTWRAVQERIEAEEPLVDDLS